MVGRPGIWPGLPALLGKAAGVLRAKDITEYGFLRGFVSSGMTGDRHEFERRFSSYYGLDAAGLMPEFRGMYFEILFGYRTHEQCDPHTPIVSMNSLGVRAVESSLHPSPRSLSPSMMNHGLSSTIMCKPFSGLACLLMARAVSALRNSYGTFGGSGRHTKGGALSQNPRMLSVGYRRNIRSC
jgi:hypothetical protein